MDRMRRISQPIDRKIDALLIRKSEKTNLHIVAHGCFDALASAANTGNSSTVDLRPGVAPVKT